MFPWEVCKWYTKCEGFCFLNRRCLLNIFPSSRCLNSLKTSCYTDGIITTFLRELSCGWHLKHFQPLHFALWEFSLMMLTWISLAEALQSFLQFENSSKQSLIEPLWFWTQGLEFKLDFSIWKASISASVFDATQYLMPQIGFSKHLCNSFQEAYCFWQWRKEKWLWAQIPVVAQCLRGWQSWAGTTLGGREGTRFEHFVGCFSEVSKRYHSHQWKCARRGFIV